jgi:hypothetical protein
MSTLDCLPDPLLQQVVGYAGDDGTSLACMSASCSALRECCNKPALWRAALISRFGEENLPVYEVLGECPRSCSYGMLHVRKARSGHDCIAAATPCSTADLRHLRRGGVHPAAMNPVCIVLRHIITRGMAS